MLTEDFALDGVTGTLKPATVSRVVLESSQLTYALQIVYPMLKDITTFAGYSMLMQVQPFFDAVLHIQAFNAPDFITENGDGKPKPATWPKPGADTETVNAAFLYFLDHKDLFEQLRVQWERLDFPNGKGGASPEQLDEAQHADPLSEKSASSSNGASANG